MTRRRGRKRTVVLTALALAAFLAAVPATRADSYTHDWSPKQGLPGVAIAVSVTGCVFNGQNAQHGHVSLYGPKGDPNAGITASVDGPVAADGGAGLVQPAVFVRGVG